MATHSSILAWGISWTEETGGLQSVGSQRVGHKRLTHSLSTQFVQFLCISFLFVLYTIPLYFTCICIVYNSFVFPGDEDFTDGYKRDL